MKRVLRVFLSGVLVSLALPLKLSALEDSKRVSELPEVKVVAPRVVLPTKEAGERVPTGYEITSEGIKFFKSKGAVQAWQVLEALPGVFFESADPSNLAGEQVGIRVRGVRGMLGSLTVLGVPNYGGNPIGPRSYLYDLENFESIALYKGAIPESLATGVGTRGGLVELRPKWPGKKPGLEASLLYGQFNYKRFFTRLDSGEFTPLKSRLSLSYSYTESDKWKGPGDLGPRNNLNFQLVQPITSSLDLRFIFNLNDQKYHKYRFLNATEMESLNQNRRLDFIENPASYLHYDYNKAKHLNRDYLVFLNYQGASPLRATLKTYLTDEEARILDGTPDLQGRQGVQERIRDIERRGLIPEVSYQFGSQVITLGYHYERSLMKISTENYWINGTALSYRGPGVVASASPTYTHSPYLQLSGKFSKFAYKAGLKYFYMKEEPSEGYVWNQTQQRLVRAPDLDRKRRTYDLLLPSLSLSYSLTQLDELYLSYGKTFIRPYAYLPLVTTYNRLRGNFTKAGVTLSELFKGLDIEETDTVELGMRIRRASLEGHLALFYSYHDKLLTNISDPRVLDGGKPVSYRQNIGKAKGWGIEGHFRYLLGERSYLFFSPTYQVVTYVKDISFQGQTYPVKGKEVVDTPRVILTAGLNYHFMGFNITPRLKYMSKRYGDIMHNEKVSSYAVVDLGLSYKREKLLSLKDFTLSLEFNNLFDKKYISIVNAFDDALSGTSYAVGAPFTVKGGVSFSF